VAGYAEIALRAVAWALFACLTLAGCAQKSTREAPVPQQAAPREPTRAQQSAELRYRAETHTQLAAEYYSIKKYDVAVEELNRALAADSSYVPAYDVLGLVYMDLRDDGQATRNFEQALRLAPNDPDVNNNYGWYLCNRGREKESLRFFQTAISDPLYRTPQKSLSNAGLCARRAGDVVAAEAYFRRAMSLAPSDPLVIFQLADIEFGRGAYPRSRDLLAMLAPGALGPEALWLGARVERKLGDLDAAASYGLQLRKRFPDAKETAMFNSGRYE